MVGETKIAIEAFDMTAFGETDENDIEILRRPLTAFNDQPLSELSPACEKPYYRTAS